MTESGVRIRDLRLSFGDREVLRGIDLDIPVGQKVALIGPSGSGKTTVLRVVAGLTRPDSGTVEALGAPIWPDDRATRAQREAGLLSVGMVFQHFNLFPHMTVLDNLIEGPVRVRRIPRAMATERALALLTEVGLSGREKAWPAQLSGGQQQRVAIARALAMEPKVLLLDEVTSALDPELVGEVLSVIRRISRESDLAILMVTHEMSFAARSVDRVLMFDEGLVVEDGTAQQVLTAPRHERTKKFLSAVIDR